MIYVSFKRRLELVCRIFFQELDEVLVTSQLIYGAIKVIFVEIPDNFKQIREKATWI